MFVNFSMVEKTKNKIVDSTLALIDKKPFPQVTTKEIAEKSGIAEVTLFRHFVNKESILSYLVDKFLTIITDLDLSSIESEEDFKDALLDFITQSHKVNYLKRRIFKFALYICMYKQDTYLTIYKSIHNKLFEPIENIVEKGKINWGYDKKVDTVIHVRLFRYGIAFFTIHQNVFRADKIDNLEMDQVFRISVDNFLKSLK